MVSSVHFGIIKSHRYIHGFNAVAICRFFTCIKFYSHLFQIDVVGYISDALCVSGLNYPVKVVQGRGTRAMQASPAAELFA
uniref:Uncharacterized protein n=1 Tax=Heterorhabditis bacteriophora TaxID=37862 RepID=A0A1I7X0E2_HETBA